jgi:ParB family transcriptional regulator, chromosome partitioning protein
MARKIQFDVSDDRAAAPQSAAPPQAEHPSRAPSLSGMARSLHAAAAAAIREIETRLIDESQFKDRLDPDDAEIAELADSIATQGQLIPILVSPIAGGRYRIVYGRRRLAALRKLGLPAKALVRELDEDQAIIAQGQENTYRKDLSWIEKAVFAKQLIEAGKADELVCDALNIDQKARKDGDKLTGLSRMKQVTARLSPALIDAVGPAPKVGRDRWYALAQQVEKKGFPVGNQRDLVTEMTEVARHGMSSDDRFQHLEGHLRRTRASTARPAPQPPARSTLGVVRVTRRSATIIVDSKEAADLHRWIAEHPEAALDALQDAQKRSQQP